MHKSQFNVRKQFNDTGSSLIEDNDIRENWLSGIQPSVIQYLKCDICYQIIIQPVQCSNCGRMFCRKDFYKLKQKSIDNCPLCKNSPFTKKQNLHIANRILYDKLQFNCKICDKHTKNKSQITYNLTQLTNHLQNIHKQKFNRQQILAEEYILEIDPILGYYRTTLALNQIQCLQILHKKKSNAKYIQVFDEEHAIISLNLVTKKFQTRKGLSGEIKSKYTKKVSIGKQYCIWTFQNQGQPHQFFIETHQIQLQDQYQKWKIIKDPKYSQIQIKAKQNRISYLINFQTMKQTNTKTKYQRKIDRLNIKINEK